MRIDNFEDLIRYIDESSDPVEYKFNVAFTSPFIDNFDDLLYIHNLFEGLGLRVDGQNLRTYYLNNVEKLDLEKLTPMKIRYLLSFRGLFLPSTLDEAIQKNPDMDFIKKLAKTKHASIESKYFMFKYHDDDSYLTPELRQTFIF
jgi:hypothetical protein